MSSQPSLITVASPATVQKPSNLQQWQLFRNTAVAGIGEYFAMNKNGVVEPIGVGGVNVPQLCAQITYAGGVLTANIVGGVAPYSYLWSFDSDVRLIDQAEFGDISINNGVITTPTLISTGFTSAAPAVNRKWFNFKVRVADSLNSFTFDYIKIDVAPA